METTKNELPQYAKQFFTKIGIYLDTPIYYFGSVQRDDYFPGLSDIDVAIFTDNNIKSLIIKLQTFLSKDYNEFKSFVFLK